MNNSYRNHIRTTNPQPSETSHNTPLSPYIPPMSHYLAQNATFTPNRNHIRQNNNTRFGKQSKI